MFVELWPIYISQLNNPHLLIDWSEQFTHLLIDWTEVKNLPPNHKFKSWKSWPIPVTHTNMYVNIFIFFKQVICIFYLAFQGKTIPSHCTPGLVKFLTSFRTSSYHPHLLGNHISLSLPFVFVLPMETQSASFSTCHCQHCLWPRSVVRHFLFVWMLPGHLEELL